MQKPTFISFTMVVMFIIALTYARNTQSDTKPGNGNSSQEPERQLKLKKEKSDILEQLLADAKITKPEIAAYVILQLIESGVIDEKDKKRDLLEELFNLAYSTQYRIKRRNSHEDADTRSGLQDYAYSLDLDTLSIQCKSVKELVSIDKEKANELFKKIFISDLKPLSCEDPMVYDVATYYSVLSLVLKNTFTKDEIKRREHVYFMEQVIHNITSPVQLGPSLKAVMSLDASSIELSSMILLLSKKMGDLSCDSRSFLWVSHSLAGDVKAAAAQCKSKGIVFDVLLNGYRSFLIRNSTKKQCNDYGDPSKIVANVQKETNSFNSLLKEFGMEDDTRVLPLEIKDLLPKDVDKSARIYAYWSTPHSQKLMKGIQLLNYRNDGKKLTLAEREQKSWQSSLAEYYQNLKSWTKGDNLSDTDFFHQKFSLLGFLLEITPSSNPQYENILSDYISFLSQDSSQQDNAIEWLWEARIPILRMEYTKQSPDKILNAYAGSNSNALQVLARSRFFIDKYKKSKEIN